MSKGFRIVSVKRVKGKTLVNVEHIIVGTLCGYEWLPKGEKKVVEYQVTMVSGKYKMTGIQHNPYISVIAAIDVLKQLRKIEKNKQAIIVIETNIGVLSKEISK